MTNHFYMHICAMCVNNIIANIIKHGQVPSLFKLLALQVNAHAILLYYEHLVLIIKCILMK